MNETPVPRWFVIRAASTLATGLLLAAGATPIEGQRLEGRVVDATTGSPIVQATIALMLDDRTITGSLTDEDGRYTIAPRDVGSYLVRVSGQGYSPLVIEDVMISRGEARVLDHRLEPKPIALDGIVVEAEAGRLTGQEKVRRRQLLGQGHFLAGREIMVLRPRSLSQYLAEEADLQVRYNRWGHPYLWSPVGPHHCVVLQVNHWPLSTQGFNSLDDIPFDWIAGIEIYNTVGDVPPEAALVEYTTRPRLYPGEQCGLVNVWFWKSW